MTWTTNARGCGFDPRSRLFLLRRAFLMSTERISSVRSDDYETQLWNEFEKLRDLAIEFEDLRIEFEKLKPGANVAFRLQQFADKLRDMRAEAKKAYDDF